MVADVNVASPVVSTPSCVPPTPRNFPPFFVCGTSLVLQGKIGPLAFRVISSHRDDLVLRAESREAMTEWRWGFFCSQQSIIARYMDNRTDGWADDKDSKGGAYGTLAAGDC